MFDNLNSGEKELLDQFATAAREFCSFVDSCARYSRDRFLQEFPVQLAKVFDLAVRLPSVNPSGSEVSFSDASVKEHARQHAAVQIMMREKLGAIDEYWEIFDSSHREDPVCGSLAGDVAEIYLDLQSSLSLLKHNDMAEEDIRWQWRFDFRSHWSRHALSALRVSLHYSDGT